MIRYDKYDKYKSRIQHGVSPKAFANVRETGGGPLFRGVGPVANAELGSSELGQLRNKR